jgi:hypothetical protein
LWPIIENVLVVGDGSETNRQPSRVRAVHLIVARLIRNMPSHRFVLSLTVVRSVTGPENRTSNVTISGCDTGIVQTSPSGYGVIPGSRSWAWVEKFSKSNRPR